MAKAAFTIDGMHCAEEVSALHAELVPLAGVQQLALYVLNTKMAVKFSESNVATANSVAIVAIGASLVVIFNRMRLLRPHVQ